MQHSNSIRRRKPSEDGYLLLSVMIMLTLLTIWLTLAVPQMIKSLQRDRDVETMERGKQYIRAIQLYYRKFHAYPPSIDALVKTDNIRFLRKRYIDPITGKDDWKPIYFGQNKAPLAMGFFGQPLGGMGGITPIAGTGPSGGNGVAGTGFGEQSGTGLGSGSGLGSSFGGGMGSSLGGSSLLGSSDNGTGTNASGTAGSGAGDNSGNSTAGAGGSTGSNGTGFMSGQTGQAFGGAGIVGVEPASPKQSILVYKKKDHYNQWEFTYSPLMEMQHQAGGNAGIGQPVGNGVGGTGTNGTNNTFGGSNNTFGGSNNTFGNSGGSFGSSPSPAQPQQ